MIEGSNAQRVLADKAYASKANRDALKGKHRDVILHKAVRGRPLRQSQKRYFAGVLVNDVHFLAAGRGWRGSGCDTNNIRPRPTRDGGSFVAGHIVKRRLSRLSTARL